MRSASILGHTGALTRVLAFALALSAVRVFAQVSPPPPPGTPTATVAAGTRYQGRLRRLFLGDTYRDLWVAPIEVPVLDLSTFAGV